MAELEKILCTEGGGCNAAEMAALMNNNGMNNPWMYLVFLALFGNGGFGFGRNGAAAVGESEILNRINALSGQVNGNQNTSMMMDAINGNHEAIASMANTLGVGFAQMQGAIGQVQNAITAVGGTVGMTGQQVINSVLLGNKDITAALQSCCCENKQLVQAMGYQNQLGQKDIINAMQSRVDQLANGIQTGFAQVGYATAQQTCDLRNNQNENTQRIIDVLNNHWQADLQQKYQDARLELSQKSQNEYLVSALKGSCGCGC